MAKITLRAYNRDIENLINHGRTQEAVDHCLHILRYFPKNIDTYRLLGKAFLEAQRYSEAADILTRVLSIIPDDFVSQLGMSIIREDEGNLDAAIFHMERAFEVKPSNSAVQDELRRLYGRRDGVEPPRVRLTRGALVRMYARGELFEQSIAEIRASLAEDPLRVDLEIILARMYLKLGRKAEAIDICNKILGKLPLCLAANRMLIESLSGTNRAAEIETFRSRLIELEPYAAFMGEKYTDSNDVPENAVTVDYLDWQPGMETPKQADWGDTFEKSTEVEASPATEFPTWLEDTSPQESQTVGDSQTQEESRIPENLRENNSEVSASQMAANTSNDQIPDWMKTAGWEPSTSEAVAKSEQEASQEIHGAETGAEEAIQADIPEWLKGMAPSETLPEEGEKDLNLEQFGQLFPSEEGAAVEQEVTNEVSPATDSITEGTELPEWMQSFAPSIENTPQENLATGLPDWLSNAEEEIGQQQAAKEATFSAPKEEITNAPEWMPLIETERVDETIVAQPTALIEPAAAPEENKTPSPKEEIAFPVNQNQMDETLAWLESLAAKQGADEETLITPPEGRTETPPDWITMPGGGEIERISDESRDTLLESAQEINQESKEKTSEILPELSESSVTLPTNELIVNPPETFAPSEDITVSDVNLGVPASLGSQDESSPSSITSFEKTDKPDEEMEHTWLETSPEKQGDVVETSTLTSDERLEAPPDWISEIEETIIEDQDLDELPVTQESEKITNPFEEESIGQTPVEDQEESTKLEVEKQSTEELPDWLQQEISPSKADARTENLPPAPSITQWLKSLEQTSHVEEVKPAEENQEGAGLPEWLQGIESDQAPELTQEQIEVDEERIAFPSESTSSKDITVEVEIPEWLANLEPTSEKKPDEDIVPEIKVSSVEEDKTQPVITSKAAEEPKAVEISSMLESPEMISKADEGIEELIPEIPIVPEIALDEGKLSPKDEEIATESPVGEGDRLTEARSLLKSGDIARAMDKYYALVDQEQYLDDVIRDLQEATYRFPVEISIYQILGDALFRANRLQDALDIYAKAEELLR